jgi:hypothetical protein
MYASSILSTSLVWMFQLASLPARSYWCLYTCLLVCETDVFDSLWSSRHQSLGSRDSSTAHFPVISPEHHLVGAIWCARDKRTKPSIEEPYLIVWTPKATQP